MYPLTYGNETFDAVVKLMKQKYKKSELFEFMKKNVKRDASLEYLRDRFAHIKKPISEDIVLHRRERL